MLTALIIYPLKRLLSSTIRKQVMVNLKGLTNVSNKIEVEGCGLFDPVSVEELKDTRSMNLLASTIFKIL